MSDYLEWVRLMEAKTGNNSMAEQKSYTDLCLELYHRTQRVLKQKQDNQTEFDMTDIRKIVSDSGIEIEEKNLCDKKDFFLKQLSGYLGLYYYDGKLNSIIYINQELGELDKRYVIAHEFAHKLLLEWTETENTVSSNCINVIFPMKTEEFAADLIASYLMLPLDKVLELMERFIQKKTQNAEIPVHMVEWIQYLASRMKLSEYQAALSFQNIRYLASIAYNNREEFPEVNWDAYVQFFQ